MTPDAHDARLEDLAWMAAHGETHHGAAKRLGISTNALQAWCRKHAPKLWAALVRNDGRRVA